MRFRADIEGLRAVAVALVVAYHVGLRGFDGGYVGVDVFFVISGFLITQLLGAELERTGTISFTKFVARRMRRLLPAALLVLGVTLIVATVLFPPVELPAIAASVRAAASYFSNEHFRTLASDYFSGSVRSNPVLHTWSLSVEEQFYLAWPWIILGVGRLATEKGQRVRWLRWALAMLCTVSFAASCLVVSTDQTLAFYSTPFRAWEFAIGGLVSTMRLPASDNPHYRTLGVSFDHLAGVVGLFLVVGASTFYSATTEFPGAAALVPVIGASLLLVAGADDSVRRGWISRILESTPFRWVGRRSYGWYLWHWPLLIFAAVWYPSNGPLLRIGVALLALSLAAVTYEFVEAPLRKHDQTVTRARWAMLAGAAASASVIAGTTITLGVANRERQDPRQRAFAAAAADLPRLYHDGCVNGEKDDRVKVCSYGPSSAPTVALYGDSHAAQWFPALEEIAKARGWRIVVAAKTQCAVAAVPAFLQSPVRRFYPCERWRAAAADSLAAYHPRLVFISNAAHYVSDHRKASIFPTVSPNVWESGLVAMLSRFDSAGVHPVLIRDTPRLKTNVPICLARSGWYRRDAERCGETRERALNPDLTDAEDRAMSEVPATGLIDLTPGICPTPICEPIIDSVVAYSDGDHLSASAARALVPDFAAEIDRVLNHVDLRPGKKVE